MRGLLSDRSQEARKKMKQKNNRKKEGGRTTINRWAIHVEAGEPRQKQDKWTPTPWRNDDERQKVLSNSKDDARESGAISRLDWLLSFPFVYQFMDDRAVRVNKGKNINKNKTQGKQKEHFSGWLDERSIGWAACRIEKTKKREERGEP